MDETTLLKNNEKFSQVVYDDATGKPLGPGSVVIGHPTVGWGRCLDTHGVLPAEAEVLLANNIADARADLALIFSVKFATFSPARQAALVDMRFNLGGAGFREFHAMVTAVLNGKWDVAAAEALNSKWATQVGKRAVDDAERLRTGNWLEYE